MDFLLHIFNVFWSLHSFLFIWKISSIIPIYKMGKPFDSPASFSLTFCVSKLFKHIVLFSLLFFLESNSMGGFFDQILHLSQSILHGFHKPKPGSRTNLATIDFSKAFDYVRCPAPFTNLFRLASFLALLVGLNISFLLGALVSLFKITKIAPFQSVEVFRKDPLLALYFSLSLSMIFLLLCLLPSAVLFTLTTWPFGPPRP